MGAGRWARPIGALCIGIGAVGVVAPLALADPDDFSMTSTTMGFGSVFVDETGTEVLTIRNIADQALAPVVTGGLVPAGEPFESTTTCDGSELEPDETCEFRYTYTPATVGADTIDVPLTLEGVSYTVSLTGAGAAPIEVSSAALAFGAVVVDETAELDVTVTNRSNITRTPSVSAPAVESDAFAATSTCGGPLAAGASCAVTYAFTPVAAGAASAGDVLVVDGVNHIVSLSGTGVVATTPTAVVANDGPVAEGSVATVSFSGQADPGGALVEPFTYSYDWDGDGVFDVVGSASAAPVPATFTADGPSVVGVTARITNAIGRFTEYETDVVVQNVAPELTVSGPDAVAVGGSGGLSVAVVDPGASVESYTYVVDWEGDGVDDQTVVGGAQRSIVQTFSDAGTFDVGVRVSDGDGGNDSATHRVTVSGSGTPSPTPTGSPTPSESPSESPTESPSETPSPSGTGTPSESPSPSEAPSPSESPSPTWSASPDPSPSTDPELPDTGTGSGVAAMLAGALLIGVGALLLLATHRPRRTA
ncbi:choice-of-anchor D domain-containing protein [Jiangella alkaliphila]|uniref:LPXTG-motif cell wall anchor domain-containing protein n=1 Tax=Jiangella alkaliphila TaxID=419479 RepID=A0A1H2H6N0_9ACTN|nr:choice-of-anchor D domain-containing protein [Jiangella alkaliphila]SDU27218.1 LPXTG-motif cell wall anchor domain-containing protein [Jiangella alkaliphila]